MLVIHQSGSVPDEMYFIWSHRLAARTLGSHPRNRSSILRGITAVQQKALDINPVLFAVVSDLRHLRTAVMDGAIFMSESGSRTLSRFGT